MTRRLAMVLATLLLYAAPAAGQERFRVNAFGGWVYGQTDANEYMYGGSEGNYENGNLAVSVATQPFSRLRLNAQMESLYDGEEMEIELDYALAEWRFHDAFRVRGGMVKHPFGLYAEVYDVGTVRPFFALPQGIYGPAGLVAEGYLGGGFTGAVVGERWSVEYDGYAGTIEMKGFADGFGFEEPALGEEEEEEEEGQELQATFGGRAVVTTPLAGLRVGVSGYQGDAEEEEDGSTHTRTVRTGGLLAEWAVGAWQFRGEAARMEHGEDLTVTAAYAELSRRVLDRFEVAVRHDRSRTVPELDEAIATDLLDHTENAVGVNWWVRPGLVVKLSVHQVDGHRFALPEEADEVGETTRLLSFGTQFSF